MQERARFLCSYYSDAEVVGIGFNCREYTDFFVDRNGDLLHLRVYGRTGTFVITEK